MNRRDPDSPGTMRTIPPSCTQYSHAFPGEELKAVVLGRNSVQRSPGMHRGEAEWVVIGEKGAGRYGT